jgi:hypothetical protein
MSVILDACRDIMTVVNDKRTKQKVLEDCAKDKMVRIFDQENAEFDSLLNKLETSIDYNEYNQVKSCVTKLLRLLSKNRKQLIKNIGRLC